MLAKINNRHIQINIILRLFKCLVSVYQSNIKANDKFYNSASKT